MSKVTFFQLKTDFGAAPAFTTSLAGNLAARRPTTNDPQTAQTFAPRPKKWLPEIITVLVSIKGQLKANLSYFNLPGPCIRGLVDKLSRLPCPVVVSQCNEQSGKLGGEPSRPLVKKAPGGCTAQKLLKLEFNKGVILQFM